jgi:hypothetical protein
MRIGRDTGSAHGRTASKSFSQRCGSWWIALFTRGFAVRSRAAPAAPLARRQRRALPPKARAAHAGPRREGHARSARLIVTQAGCAPPLAAFFADRAQLGQPPCQYGPALARTLGARRAQTSAPWGLDLPWRLPFSSLRTAAAIVPSHPISSSDSPRCWLAMSTWSPATEPGKDKSRGEGRVRRWPA